jgi:hypothetical protein
VIVPGGGLKAYFGDPDTDVVTYHPATEQTSSVIIRETSNAGFLVDVLYEDGQEFAIEVYAKDDAGARSPHRSVPVLSAKPRDWSYDVDQYIDGGFRTETVGLRWETVHTLNLLPPEGLATPTGGALQFVLLANALLPSHVTPDGTDPQVAMGKPDDVDLAALDTGDAGMRWLTIVADTPVVIEGYTPGEIPVLSFKLSKALVGGGYGTHQEGTATITFTYHVVYDADDDDGTEHTINVHSWKTTLDLFLMHVR